MQRGVKLLGVIALVLVALSGILFYSQGMEENKANYSPVYLNSGNDGSSLWSNGYNLNNGEDNSFSLLGLSKNSLILSLSGVAAVFVIVICILLFLRFRKKKDAETEILEEYDKQQARKNVDKIVSVGEFHLANGNALLAREKYFEAKDRYEELGEESEETYKNIMSLYQKIRESEEKIVST